ncbi:carbohydrate ABC transporter permease [Pelagibius litoralis]|uniref:carbohydrate ABC transporter permease n=1 Tax=Pelagibius litoralis TaxID=374515 RepID=UPI001981BDD9|nr:sugar ABC transporter permease [Pelagibius litoralis]
MSGPSRSKKPQSAIKEFDSSTLRWLQQRFSQIVVAPSFAAVLIFVYGFILWNGYISVSESRMLPDYDFAGLAQYERLWAMPRWHAALSNMFVFGRLYIFFSLAIGVLLAIFLDQRIRLEGTLRTIFLYPMALSFIVTGTVWKWLLNPGVGVQKFVQDLGFSTFTFDWIIDREMVVYTLVIAAVWQSSGFVMAPFFAGWLRGQDLNLRPSGYEAGGLDNVGPIWPSWCTQIAHARHLPIEYLKLVVQSIMGAIEKVWSILVKVVPASLFQVDPSNPHFPYFSEIRQWLEIGSLAFDKLRPEATGRLCEAGLPIEKTSPITGHNDWKMLRRDTSQIRKTHIKVNRNINRLSWPTSSSRCSRASGSMRGVSSPITDVALCMASGFS